MSSPRHEELHVNGWRFGSSAVRRSLTGWQGSSPLLAYSSLSATANIVPHTHTHKHTHTFGPPSATRTIPLDSHNAINLKQTKIARRHMMATKQIMLIDISKSVSSWR